MSDLARKRRGNAQVTAEDVARALGVSQSTISRAFTVSASIATETRARVMAAATALGYQPNVIARSLITRRTNIVAIVMENLTDPFYPVVLEELTQRIQSAGCQTLLFVPSYNQDVEDILPTLLQYQVDAIVITSATLSSTMVRTCAARETPVVLLNRYVPGLEILAVSCDNVAGGRQVAEFLARQAHVRPAYVAGPPNATTNLDRKGGFLSRLEDLGIRSWLLEEGGSYSYEAGFAAAKRLAARRERPDAIFFASDIMAFGGMEALREAGLRIPDDVSVVGFDDVPIAAWPSHGLTTVRQPVKAMVEAAIDMVGLGAYGPAAPTTRFIAGTLVERRSTMDRRRLAKGRGPGGRPATRSKRTKPALS
jgi:DNA-binding LacI/PurR family transcriptional regulator